MDGWMNLYADLILNFNLPFKRDHVVGGVTYTDTHI